MHKQPFYNMIGTVIDAANKIKPYAINKNFYDEIETSILFKKFYYLTYELILQI